MREFIVLAGQIVFIALLQMILEAFLDPKDRPYHVKILNIACIMFSMYLLMQFVFNYILGEISTFMPIWFP